MLWLESFFLYQASSLSIAFKVVFVGSLSKSCCIRSKIFTKDLLPPLKSAISNPLFSIILQDSFPILIQLF